MRRQQIFSDDTEIAPATGRKKTQIGHRDGLLQEPALVIQDEVFGRHNKQGSFASSRSVDLNSDAKALKSSARRSSIGRTSKTSVRTRDPEDAFDRAGEGAHPPPTCASYDTGPAPAARRDRANAAGAWLSARDLSAK